MQLCVERGIRLTNERARGGEGDLAPSCCAPHGHDPTLKIAFFLVFPDLRPPQVGLWANSKSKTEKKGGTKRMSKREMGNKLESSTCRRSKK